MPGTKSSKTNFLWRCDFCKRQSSATFDEPFGIKKYTAPEDGDRDEGWKPLLVLDCRGLEFVDFDATGTWKCRGIESRTEFNEVDLSEQLEWTDYDEKAKLPVSVMDIEAKWSKA